MANYKTLTYGDANEDVKKLQQSLNEKAGAGLATDGIYGEKTRSAVRSYQKANNLVSDGIAGNQTLGHLYGTAVTQSAPAQTTSDRTDLEKDWQNYLNREVFSYDPEKDPLYQQYRNQYANLGQLAMEDTMGQAAALTGGYGNSYAQTAGQQTYQGYLQQLNNVMPELYGAAYNRYQAEGEALYNQILLQEQRKQDTYEKLTSLMALGYDPTGEELTAAGLTQAQASALRNYYTPASTGTGTGSGSYTGYDNGGYSDAVVRLAQDYFGVTADGMWGQNSTKAGGSIDRAVATMLEKGKTSRTLQIYNKVGSEADWAARGVSRDNYLAIAEAEMENADKEKDGLNKEEYFYLAYRFGLL